MNEIELWRLPTLKQKTGLSRSEIYRRIAAGLFPKPRKYPGSRISFWPSNEVIQVLEAMLTPKDTAPARSATCPGMQRNGLSGSCVRRRGAAVVA